MEFASLPSDNGGSLSFQKTNYSTWLTLEMPSMGSHSTVVLIQDYVIEMFKHKILNKISCTFSVKDSLFEILFLGESVHFSTVPSSEAIFDVSELQQFLQTHS